MGATGQVSETQLLQKPHPIPSSFSPPTNDGRNQGGGDNNNLRQEETNPNPNAKELESTPDAAVSRLQPHPPVTPIQVFPSSQPRQVVYSHDPQSETLNSPTYTNKITLLLFVIHMLVAAAAMSFFTYKAIKGALRDTQSRRERRHLSFWVPPVSGSLILSILLAFVWQKALRAQPSAMVPFVLWFCFFSTMSVGVLLLCLSLPSTTVLGVFSIAFSIGVGLYACWVTRRTGFTARVFVNSLAPAARFPDLNRPAYFMLGVAFVWISIWCFAVIGALYFYYPPLIILGMVVSLMWTAEVMRNVANLTVSRVVALYYLRGMQSTTEFCFLRAVTKNLGSACLGSLFVPAIEACRILARGLNLLEGEDEFMFSCAHCCLHFMEALFRYGNSWAFVHIAAYGRDFVRASQSTWGLFEKAGMAALVDADITSSICFLSGVSSGALCAIFAAAWTFTTHKHFTATVSLLAFFIGYLMTRIGMALVQACVGCYYVCYAENPRSRLFTDTTIPDRIAYINNGRDTVAPTPRFPGRFSSA